MRKPIGLAIAGALVASVVAFVSPAGTADAAPSIVPVPAGCTGGIVTNPSVEQTTGSAPTGFTKVGPGTLATEPPYAYDGRLYAWLSSPQGQTTTAYQDVLPAVPGGVYDLAFWGGTHNPQMSHITGLRFLNAAGAVIQEKSVQVDYDVDPTRKLQRYDIDGSVAPAGTAKVRFFASANGDYNKFDCVYLRVAAYDVLKEVQNPAGQWLDADADAGTAGSNDNKAASLPAGATAKYRVTVTNVGTQPLSNVTPADPWCTSPLTGAAIPFDLAKGAKQVLTCDHASVTLADNGHVNTVTVSKVTYPQGSVPDKSEKAKIEVLPAYKIGDFVWIDQNRNGLQDSGEPGVPNVTVRLQKADGTAVGTPIKTDSNGKYLFDKLPDGSFKVCFDLTALPAAVSDFQLTTPNAGQDGTDSDADPATGCTEPVTLNVNSPENMTLDAGLVSPLNRLGDFVWVDVNKNGLQDDGEPVVPGVSVVAKDAGGAEVGTDTTDDTGKYLIDNLPDGTYTVCFGLSALPAAFADYQGTQANVGTDDAKDSDADPATGCTEPVELGAGKRENYTLDAGLVSPPNRLGDFVWVDSNKNGLQDSGEPGVPDVSVVVKNAQGDEVGSTTTDGTGMYAIDNLPDGAFIVCFGTSALPAAYADYQVTTRNAGEDNLDSDADPASGCAEPVELGPGKRENITVDAGLVSPPNRVGDFVWIDTNKNGLQDDSEPVVPGVSVVAKNADGAEVGTDTTDDKGQYFIENLPDGSYTVCFGLTNLPAAVADFKVTQANAGTDDTRDSDADPTTGCTESVELGIGKRENLTLDAGLVSPPNKLGDFVWVDLNKNGLQDANEPGVAGVSVVAKNTDGVEVGTDTTDDNGAYAIDNLPDGSFTACFGLSDLPAAYADYQAAQTNAGEDAADSDADPATGCTEPVELGPGKRENLTLDAGIISPANKLGDSVWVDSNKNGLQDADESGVEGVSVVAKRPDGSEAGTATTDDGGKYLIDNLPDGTYSVCFGTSALPAAVADYQVTQANAGTDDALDSDADTTTGCTESVDLGIGKRENYTLDAGLVSPPNKLGDFVWVDTNKNGLQDDGEPGVPGVPVVVKNAQGDEVGSTTTDGTGMYAIDNLPDGTFTVCFGTSALPAAYADYQVTTRNAGEDNLDSDADPTTGCAEPVELGLGKRENITVDAGLVSPTNKLGDFVWIDTNKNGLQDDGEPVVPGVSVVAKNADGAEVGTDTTDDAGNYLIDNLPDGSYTVCFGTSALPAAVADYQVTQANAGTDDALDSDADTTTGCTESVELGVGKRGNYTLDAGLVSPPNRLGDFVWVDTNKNGLQDGGEPGVPDVSVVVKNAEGVEVGTATTDGNGKYSVDNLPDGMFTVCFGLKSLPAAYADYQTTQANAGEDATDSDADPATGCAEPVELGLGKRENITVDAGIISPTNRLGDFVWVDSNKNGLQDDGEPVVPDVNVVAKNAQGAEVGTDTTDDKGQYFIENLPDGTYSVCFGTSALPAAVADFKVTQANAGTDDAKDSDADATTGCTEPVELGIGKRENLTLDAGIVSPLNSLGDFVWVDLNKNGLQDTDEPGVPDVNVVVKDANGSEVTSTTTDGTGMYKFDILPDGSFTVCFGLKALPATYADYQTTQTNAGEDAADSDADQASGCAEPVELGLGKRENLTVDAGIISPANRLGDYVWVDLNKNGLQDTDEPGVEGVSVVAKRPDGSEAGTTTTDGGGKYLIDNLPDGTYSVCFGIKALPSAYSDYLMTQTNAGTDDALDSDADSTTGCTEPAELGVGKRENYTLDAGLMSPPNRLGDFVWVDTNKNGTQDSGEPGVPDVTVVVKNANGDEVGTATTDGNGNYIVENLPDGSFTVCFGQKSLPANFADYQVTKPNAGEEVMDSDADPASGCTEPVNLGPGNRENLTVDAGIASPANKLGDYVWIDSNDNGTQDSGESGVDGVTVVLRSGDTEVATTKTGAGGKYLFDDLKDGSYRVCFDVKALPAVVADYRLTELDAGDDNAVDSDADPNGCTETVTLGVGKRENYTLDAGLVAPPNKLGDFVWVDTNRNGVQDSGEPGAEDVTVVLRSGDTEVTRMQTDPSGKYEFDELPNGTYRVCFEVASLPAEYAGYLLTAANTGADGADSDADMASGCTEPVELGVGKRENLTLDAGIRPPNKLGDRFWLDTNGNGVQDDGEPGVPGVSVTLKKEDGTVIGTTKTDNSGKYGFDKLPDGSYLVCFDRATLPATYADYQLTKPNTGDEAVDSDADPSTWCIPPTKLYVGHPEYQSLDAGIVAPRNRIGDYVWIDKNRNGVQDPGEPAAAGVPVILLDASGKEIGKASTDPSGKYLFDGLPDGTYQVCFRGTLPAALAEYAITKASAGPDAADSDADQATGCTRKVTVGPNQREILLLDAGLVAPQLAPAPAPKPSAGLPDTGANVIWLVTLGLFALGLGALLAIATRRRRTRKEPLS